MDNRRVTAGNLYFAAASLSCRNWCEVDSAVLSRIFRYRRCRSIAEFLARIGTHVLRNAEQTLGEDFGVVAPVDILPNVLDDLGDR